MVLNVDLDHNLSITRRIIILRKLGSGGAMLVPLLCELVVEQLLLGQLRLLEHLPQHLMHHAEQRAAQAQQLKQEHIVV